MKKFFSKKINCLMVSVLTVLIVAVGLFCWWEISRQSGVQVKGAMSTPQVTATTTNPDKFKEFGLQIDKLNIIVPVIKDVDGKDKAAYDNALKDGVAHFKGTSLPGENGNIFIFGHSSAEVKSDYSKIFATLNNLEKGDEVILFYQNNEHKYKVSEKKIVAATDLSVLAKGKKEILTLMTCWPIGTKDKRLIIRAEPV